MAGVQCSGYLCFKLNESGQACQTNALPLGDGVAVWKYENITLIAGSDSVSYMRKLEWEGEQYMKIKRIREIEQVYGTITLLFSDLVYLRLRLRSLLFKSMNCCSPYPIMLNIVALLSPVLTS